MDEERSNEADTSASDTCSVCWQNFRFPVSLPCGHVFCFLCIKGAFLVGGRCPNCRREIDGDFIRRPNFVHVPNEASVTSCLSQAESTNAASPDTAGNDGGDDGVGYAWFYKGRNGWWLYDSDTMNVIENAYSQGLPSVEILIVGHIFVIDFSDMKQYRRDNHRRARAVKRDRINAPSKGIAGVYIRSSEDQHSANAAATDSAVNSDDMDADSVNHVINDMDSLHLS